MDSSWKKNREWESDKQIIKGKPRRLSYNKDLNLYKRQRTFDGIYHLGNWEVISKHIDVNKPLKCLEVGTHEGQSSMYFLKNILKNPKSKLLCCDPWIKSHWLNLNPSNLCYEDVFDFNVKNNIKLGSKNKLKKYRGKNSDLYKENWFKSKNNKYDIIYIDDIHTYESTKLNIENGFPKLKVGGIMIFDDYDKNFAIYGPDKNGKDAAFWCDPVKKAVDELLKKEKNNIEIVFQEYQMIIKKIKNEQKGGSSPYLYIIDPYTGTKLNIFENSGKKILNKYIYFLESN